MGAGASTQFAFEAIGTQWVIDVYSLPKGVNLDRLLQEIRERIEVFDSHYSRFRNDSLIAQMADRAGSYSLPEDADPLFSLYWRFYQLTDGAFTPLIGAVLEQAGYDAVYSLQERDKKQPTQRWENILDYSAGTVRVHEPAVLDFGAAGKGYLVDIVAEILERQGITDYCVDAGGDMRYCSSQISPLRVGLENPLQENQVIGVVELQNASICSSAGNRRRWGKYHHILDPVTQESPHDIAGTWVTAASTMEADALATSLFLVSPEKLAEHFSFEYLIMYDDYRVKKSSGFSGQLFSAERTI